jgi:hypothetical protein
MEPFELHHLLTNQRPSWQARPVDDCESVIVIAAGRDSVGPLPGCAVQVSGSTSMKGRLAGALREQTGVRRPGR